MKRLRLIIALLLACSSHIFAQSMEVNNAYNYLGAGELDKAKESIDKATVNEKTGVLPKTWYYKGLIYKAINESDNEKYKSLDENALKTSYEALLKCKDLDTKNQYLLEVNSLMPRFANKFAQKGVTDFGLKNYPSALENFQYSLKINPSDTPLIYNCAITAQNAGFIPQAKTYFQSLIDMKYKNVEIYRSLESIYKMEKDTNSALKVIELGKAEFPSYVPLMIDEVNIYLNRGQTKDLVSKLNEAIAVDPQNKTLYLALGIVQDNLNNKKESATAYKKAIEVDSTYFDAIFNLGALYFNEAVETFRYVNDLPTSKQKEYDAGKIKYTAQFAEALPYLEKALRMSPTDKGALMSLREIYARTGNMPKSIEMKKRLDELK